jgi:folate-binding protein YgfZ
VKAIPVEAIDPSDVDAGVAAHYGDPLREQRRLATDVGLVDRSNRGVIAISGPDRLTWLHSMTTQQLEDLPPLTGTELLFLSPNGHVEHHAALLDDGTTTYLDVEPGTVDSLVDFLNRMRFLLRVEPVRVDWAVLSLLGPRAAEALARLGVEGLAAPHVLPVPGPKFATGAAGSGATTRYAVAGLPKGGFVRRMGYGYDLVLPISTVDAEPHGRLASFADAAAALGVEPAGVWAFEALRVADRRARLRRDTDHRTLPSEVGWMAPAVHLEKGCYRGQETVARVHHLGRPPRRLVLLHLDGLATDELPKPGTEVTNADGRTVGFVGTAVHHFELGQIALSVIKQNVPDDAELRVGPSTAAIDR